MLKPTLTLDSLAGDRVKGRIPAPRSTTRLYIGRLASTLTECTRSLVTLDDSPRQPERYTVQKHKFTAGRYSCMLSVSQLPYRLARRLDNASYNRMYPSASN